MSKGAKTNFNFNKLVFFLNESFTIIIYFLVVILAVINMDNVFFLSVYLIVTNLIFCAFFILDKYKSHNQQYRISEQVLCVFAFLSLNLTSLLLQTLIRHKTLKLTFNLKLLHIFILQIAALLFSTCSK